jgi:hypothetical protein
VNGSKKWLMWDPGLRLAGSTGFFEFRHRSSGSRQTENTASRKVPLQIRKPENRPIEGPHPGGIRLNVYRSVLPLRHLLQDSIGLRIVKIDSI